MQHSACSSGSAGALWTELPNVGIPVGIRLVMVHFLPVYGSRLRAHVDPQGADNRLDGDDSAHPVLHPFRGPGTRTASLVPDPAAAVPLRNERLRNSTSNCGITRLKQSRPTSEIGHHHLQQLRHRWYRADAAGDVFARYRCARAVHILQSTIPAFTWNMDTSARLDKSCLTTP